MISSRSLLRRSGVNTLSSLLVLPTRPQSTFPKTLPSSSSSLQQSDTYESQIFKPKLERSQGLKELITQCSSCGVSLQTTDKDSVGFYIEPKSSSSSSSSIIVPRYQSKKLQFISAFSKLDEEGRQFLESATGRSTIKERTTSIPHDPEHEHEQEALTCLRCHNALHHNIYNPQEHQPMNLYSVLDTIPKKDSIIHIFSALDFPLSLVPLTNRRNVSYVLNKSDMLCAFDSMTRKYSHYFQTMVDRLVGSPSKLHIVSAHTSWAMEELYSAMGSVNYLVGFVNAGKTRLANRVWNVSNKLDGGSNGNKKKVLGSSHLPALTRENIKHVCGEKVVVDTPGFLDSNGLFPLIKEDHLKTILQGRKVLVNDLKKEHYESIKSGQVITIGGVFFIQVPQGGNTIVQLKPVCRGKPWVFSSMEKAINTVGDPPEALKDTFSVKSEAMDDMVRYVIPPFHGTVDLIIKDVGYVQLKPTGAKNNNKELFEVWAPRGVVLGVRETIEHFMTRYLKTSTTKTVKRGKDKGKDKEIIKMRAKLVPDYKVFSRLYEIPKDCSDPYDEMRSQYAHHLREFGSSYKSVMPKEVRDETRNEFWIEKL